MSDSQFFPIQPQPPQPCISLIGMAGAGKSTVGRALAKHLDWALADTDHIIEAHYGVILQDLADALSKDEFLELESQVIQKLNLNRCVLATGGSVIYREAAMRRLTELGPVVHLDVDFEIIEERIARNPNRGLAIAPGQTIRDLFLEREALYRKYATHSIQTSNLTPPQCAQKIAELVKVEIEL